MPHSPLDHLSPHSCLSVGLFLPAYHTDCSNILAILAVLSLSTHFCRLSALSWFNLTYIACGHSLLFHAQHQHWQIISSSWLFLQWSQHPKMWAHIFSSNTKSLGHMGNDDTVIVDSYCQKVCLFSQTVSRFFQNSIISLTFSISNAHIFSAIIVQQCSFLWVDCTFELVNLYCICTVLQKSDVVLTVETKWLSCKR